MRIYEALIHDVVKWRKRKMSCHNVSVVKRKFVCEKKKKPVEWKQQKKKKKKDFSLTMRHAYIKG